MNAPDSTFTKHAAEEYAARLREYWRQYGYVIEVWIESSDGKMKESLSCVRSNLVRGLPANWKPGVKS